MRGSGPSHNSRSESRGNRPDDADLTKGKRVVLTAIAQHNGARVSREQLTVLTGYKRSSRDTYLQKLKQGDLVDEDRDGFCVTRSGSDALGADFEPMPMGDALREHWLRELPQGERVVLAIVTKAYPKDVDRDAISAETGYQRSSRDTYLQKLMARRLVDATGRGQVRASAELFS